MTAESIRGLKGEKFVNGMLNCRAAGGEVATTHFHVDLLSQTQSDVGL
jgi:hypothetical protein